MRQDIFPEMIHEESILSALTALTGECIMVVDGAGRVVNANQPMEKILLSLNGQLAGKILEELPVDLGLREVLTTGRSVLGEAINIEGQNYICSRRAFTENGRVMGAVAVLQAAVEPGQAEKELSSLQNLQELLETVIDISCDGIVVVDEDTRIILFNRAYCEFLGVKREEVLGKRVQDVIENTRMHIVLRTGRAEIGDVQRIKGNDMVCSRVPLKWDGKVRAAVGKVMFRDVSDLRTLLKRVDCLQAELKHVKGELRRYQHTRYSLDSIISVCPRMLKIKEMAAQVALSDSTVLIKGESGTGKELFAHALHNASRRFQHPFVKINCAALPGDLLESELFGYTEGAFTGARKGGKIGKFELADRGTIFLDEVGDMPLHMQVKLLRVLQEKEIERLGENRPLQVDIRVIAATNRNLEDMARQGLFREDLFYRLNVVVLDIPPLRERAEDIPVVVDFLLKKISNRLGYPVKSLDQPAMKCFLAHHWPGNIRELENVLERVLNVVEGEVISENHLPLYLRREEVVPVADKIGSLREAVEDMEKKMILRTLEATAGDCLAAARLLQISKSTFYEKMCRYKIKVEDKV